MPTPVASLGTPYPAAAPPFLLKPLHRSELCISAKSVLLLFTHLQVPAPVMSLALTPTSAEQFPQLMKALQRFQKEDPTFRVRGKGVRGRGNGRACLMCRCDRIRSATYRYTGSVVLVHCNTRLSFSACYGPWRAAAAPPSGYDHTVDPRLTPSDSP